MFDWLFGKKRRDEERIARLMKAAAIGDRLHRVRRAIATISPEPLTGKDATEQAGEASATLTSAIVKATVLRLDVDDDFFVASIFAFVISDYFAHLLGGSFEMASTAAVLKLMGIERFKQAFPTILEDYNNMVHSKSNIIEAIGKTCEAWFKNPTPSEFERLTELFKLARTHVQARPV